MCRFFTLGAILPEKTTSRIKYHDLINLLHTCGRWFVVLPDYDGDQEDLEMVDGADKEAVI